MQTNNIVCNAKPSDTNHYPLISPKNNPKFTFGCLDWYSIALTKKNLTIVTWIENVYQWNFEIDCKSWEQQEASCLKIFSIQVHVSCNRWDSDLCMHRSPTPLLSIKSHYRKLVQQHDWVTMWLARSHESIECSRLLEIQSARWIFVLWLVTRWRMIEIRANRVLANSDDRYLCKI